MCAVPMAYGRVSAFDISAIASEPGNRSNKTMPFIIIGIPIAKVTW